MYLREYLQIKIMNLLKILYLINYLIIQKLLNYKMIELNK